MNKDYSFKIAYNQKCVLGKMIYNSSAEVCFIPNFESYGVFFELYIGYVRLAFHESIKRAEWLGGHCYFGNWKFQSLVFPLSYKSELYIENDISNHEFMYEYYVDNWPRYYDKNRNILCMGDPNVNDNDEAVEFCTDIVAVLEDGKYLKAIWIKNMEFEGGRPF